MRASTLDGSLMTLRGVTYTDFSDLAGLNSEITLVPIAELVPFHDAGLRVKRLKEPSSSAELVLVVLENKMYTRKCWALKTSKMNVLNLMCFFR